MRLYKSAFIVICILLSTIIHAQYWSSSNTSNRSISQQEFLPDVYKEFSLDFTALKSDLQQADVKETRIQLPRPDGSIEHFMVEEANVFHPDLIKRYPNLRAYKGYSLDTPGSYLRMGYGENKLHAMILREGAQATFIDFINDTEAQYAVYYKNDYGLKDRHQFECLVTEDRHETSDDAQASTRHSDCQLRKYRLALACTGEYASYHGGTVESVLAEYNVAMTRVNGLYERDAGITMEIIANTDELIFLDASTDPYTNNDGATMLGENQAEITATIGADNYDIGHVFSTGGGGIARLNSPCRDNLKAMGVTGLGAPQHDPFYIDYVAHEMGHQFGANHTQNNSCNRNSDTAMEPGSASTIMGYAGICAPNVQSNSDDYFHSISLIEIADFVTGTGNSCAEIIATDNTAPSVTVPQATVSIPTNTSFLLTADATDADGDLLTYCWEQMDNETATMPPQSTNVGGPLFRSFSPSTSPTRFFPQLSGESTWEILPSVAREMNFICTVRDNNTSVGCTGEASILINVIETDNPFTVISPNTNVIWPASDTKTITWDVADTDLAPISTPEVDIYLSFDGGQTFDFLLAENTPNDGTHDIIVPNMPSDMVRVVIVGSENVFYDMSDENFSITSELSVTITPFSQVACGEDQLVYTANLLASSTFDEEVSLSVEDLPGDATAVLSPMIVVPPAEVTITINGLESTEAGSYLSTLVATSENLTVTEIFSINIQNNNLDKTTTTLPLDGAVDVDFAEAVFSWEAQEGVSIYQFEISSTPEFDPANTQIGTPSSSTITRTNLEKSTVYYWRVRARSICSTGLYSDTQSFRTSDDGCELYASTAPVTIPEQANVEVTSAIEMPIDVDFSEAVVHLDISHTFIGDLIGVLTSPDDVSFDLFDRPGYPSDFEGCSRNDILVTFSNDADLTAVDFESTCENTSPAISGDYQAIDVFTNTNTVGTWTLSITDVFQQDGGSINSWSIEACSPVSIPDVITTGSKNITVLNGGSAAFDNTILSVTSDNPFAIYITQLPTEGILMRGNEAVVVGELITEMDLMTGAVSYVHSDNESMEDQFVLDVVVAATGAWLKDQIINIDILQNGFQVVGNVTQGVSCYEGMNGIIVATAVDGVEPYQYSIDNTTFQSETTFAGLTAGEYTIYVTDADGALAESEPIEVNQAAPILLTTMTMAYSIIATAEGGTGNIEYSIDGINYSSEGEFSNLDNGTYTIYAKDANECIVTTTEMVSVALLSAEFDIMNLNCANEPNGSITVNGMGGVTPYEYSIDGGDFESNNVFSSLDAGTYSIIIKDAGGKQVLYDDVVVTSPTAITFGYQLNGDQLTINAEGGTGSYIYSLNAVDLQSSNTFTIDPEISYTLYIADANSCLYSFDLSISAITDLTVNVIDVCFGEEYGSILISGITGGETPFQYALNDGPFQSTNVFIDLEVGTYDVTVRDANGAEFTLSNIEVSNNPQIGLDSFTSSDTLYVMGSGGSPGYSYAIDGGDFSIDGFFTDLPDGTYTISVQDDSGCVENFTIMYTDVNDIIGTKDIRIYPNPVSDLLQIELLDGSNSLQSVKLYALDNKLILQHRMDGKSSIQSIDVSRVNDGLYMLYLETAQGVLLKRVSIIK